MSKHPTERVRTVQELQATSMQQSDKALRRIALIEERLARSEGRLAEKDQMLADFQEAYARQADTITVLTAVVRELEAKVGRGVDQVITGLEGRISELEREFPLADGELRDLIEMLSTSSAKGRAEIESRLGVLESKPKQCLGFFDYSGPDIMTLGKVLNQIVEVNVRGDLFDESLCSLSRRLDSLEAKPKRGRPKGSKNKPKVVALSAGGATQAEAKANLQAKVDKLESESSENAALDGDSSNPEASEG